MLLFVLKTAQMIDIYLIGDFNKITYFLWSYNKIKQQRLLWHKPCVLVSLAAYGSKVTKVYCLMSVRHI